MTLRIEVAQQDLVTSRFAHLPAVGADPGAAHAGRPAVARAAALRPWLVRVRDRYQRLARDADLACCTR